MHMEQRHDQQRAIFPAQFIRLGNVPQACNQVALCQWYSLWPTSCAAGMQEKRDVLSAGPIWRAASCPDAEARGLG